MDGCQGCQIHLYNPVVFRQLFKLLEFGKECRKVKRCRAFSCFEQKIVLYYT